MGLVEFLRARLDEREQRIREFTAYRKRLHDEDETADGGWDLWGEFGRLVDSLITPDDWLAEVDAKRAFIDDAVSVIRSYENDNAPDTYGGVGVCEDMLARMAAAYAAHPDYDEAWRP